MADSLIPASAQAGRHGLTATPEVANRDNMTNEMDAPDALSNKTALNPSTTLRETLPPSDMDVFHEHRFERHETFDSISSFGGNNRTNTMSTYISTGTDITEPDNDHATLHDEEEGNASSPRRFTLPCRSNTLNFQSPPPSRTQSFNVMDYDHPRQGQLADEPDVRMATRQLAMLRARDRDHSQPAPSAHQDSSAQTPPAALAQGVDDLQSGPASPGAQSQGQQPGTSQTNSDNTSTAGDAANWTPDDMSDVASDDLGDSDISSNKLDDKVVQDACEKLLKHVFGVELHDLAGTDAGSEAYSSVKYCLEELSRILPSGSTSFAPEMLQVMARDGASGHGAYPSAGNRQPQGGRNAGNGNGGGGGQKRRQEGDDSPGREGYDDGSLGGGGGGGKKQKTTDPGRSGDLNLSCPFRKRNPAKFNVRDYQSCAVQSFPDISQLKRHVKIFHKQKVVSTFACPRCKIDMETKEGLQIHLHAPRNQICEAHEAPSSQDPEDGISAKVEDVLNGRRANTKVDSWKILWQTLFPDDAPEDIRDSEFIPPIEFDEVFTEFQARHWHDMLTEQVSKEERSAADSSQDIEAHIARVVKICQEHINLVFNSCHEQKVGNRPAPRRRRRGATGAPKATVSPNPAEHSQSTLPPLVIYPGSRIAVSDGSSPHSSPHDTGSGGGSLLGSQQSSQIEDMTTPTGPSPHFDFPPNGSFDIQPIGPANVISGSMPRRARPFPPSPVAGLGFQNEPHHNRVASGDSGISFGGMPGFQDNTMYQQPLYPQQSQAPFQAGFTGSIMGQGETGPFAMTGPITTMTGSGAVPNQLLAFTQPMTSSGYVFPPQQGYGGRDE
ncbi:hypothetical protein OQA88_11515 [Cercophora sp. LCS_1]